METEELTYNEAMEQIQEILRAINENSLDVDVLGERVARATELIALCRGKLQRASAQVEAATAVSSGAESGAMSL